MSDQPEMIVPEDAAPAPPDAQAAPPEPSESSEQTERPPRPPNEHGFFGLGDKQLNAYTAEIAALLGETLFVPKQQIRNIIFKHGIEKVRSLVAEVMEIEANGGMMVQSGKRRRTPGGIFFYKVNQMDPGIRPRRGPFPREKLLPMVEKALQNVGEVSEPVRVQVVGLPSRIERRDDVCVLTLQEQQRPDNLSNLLPAWPETPTTYVVYMLTNSWKKVERQIDQNPGLLLDMEGELAFDPELGQVIVFAQRVGTRVNKSPEAKEAAAAAKAAREEAERPIREAKQAEKQARKEAAKVEKAAAKVEKAMQRLQALTEAVQAAEAKLEEIRALPPSQQQGLFTAMREVQRARDELQKFREQAQSGVTPEEG